MYEKFNSNYYNLKFIVIFINFKFNKFKIFINYYFWDYIIMDEYKYDSDEILLLKN